MILIKKSYPVLLLHWQNFCGIDISLLDGIGEVLGRR